MEFVRWFYIHPKVMAERTAIFECREALLWEQDIGTRRTIADRLRFLMTSIDRSLSGTIVVKNIDQQGVTTWPWPHPALWS